MPSPIKKWLYRLKGYRVGKGVSFGFGSVVCGETVDIGERTSLGVLSWIRGETIRLGSHVRIGATTFIDTAHVDIGDGTRINEQVFIGGLQFPGSRLTVGRNCQIMQMTFINPARSITIGDDTGVGGHCLVFGHTSWLSKFEGYPVDFEDIEIGSSVAISWRVFVLPGSRIGDGVVVGANSLVRGTIPPRCLAVGFPARVVRTPPEFPRQVSDDEKKTYLKEIVDEMLAYFQASGLTCRSGNADYEIIDHRPRGWFRRQQTWKLAVHPDEPSDQLPTNLDVMLSLTAIPTPLRQKLSARRVMWIDIERKERSDYGNDLGEEVAQYLKRYGVRLFRCR